MFDYQVIIIGFFLKLRIFGNFSIIYIIFKFLNIFHWFIHYFLTIQNRFLKMKKI
jgi:hypothetical protein